MRLPAPAILLATLAAASTSTAAGGRVRSSLPAAGEEGFDQLELGHVDGLSLCDLDGDRRLELLVADDRRLFTLSLDGTPIGAAVERREERALGFCVAPSPFSEKSVYLIQGQGEVVLWRAVVDPATGQPRFETVPLIQDREIALPAQIVELRFAQDVDGDGAVDLVLPLRDSIRICFAEKVSSGAAPRFRRGPRVRQEVRATLVFPKVDDLRAEVSQTIDIPAIDVEDQNGDGHPDLSSRSQDLVQFYWSDGGGNLPEAPTFELDLKGIRESLDGFGEETLDPTNLFKALRGVVSHEIRDFDGDGRIDLLLRQGPKISLFAGGEKGFDRDQAVQVLKTSGNLLAAFSADDNHDGRADLCMLRINDLSLADVLFWLVAGGSLKLDLFAYHQEAPRRFARKPSSQRTVHLSFPALLSLGDDLEEEGKRFARTAAIVPAYATLGPDRIENDVVRITDDRAIEVFLDVETLPSPKESSTAWKDLLARYDLKVRRGEPLDLKLKEIFDWVPLPRAALKEKLRLRQPDRRLSFAAAGCFQEEGADADSRPTLFVEDIDFDGVDDFLVLYGLTQRGPYHLLTSVSGRNQP